MLPWKKQWAVLRTLKPHTVFLLDCGSASCLPGHVKWILIHAVAVKLSFSSLKKTKMSLATTSYKQNGSCHFQCGFRKEMHFRWVSVTLLQLDSFSQPFLRDTGFDSFSHDHYFIRKYVDSGRSRRESVVKKNKSTFCSVKSGWLIFAAYLCMFYVYIYIMHSIHNIYESNFSLFLYISYHYHLHDSWHFLIFYFIYSSLFTLDWAASGLWPCVELKSQEGQVWRVRRRQLFLQNCGRDLQHRPLWWEASFTTLSFQQHRERCSFVVIGTEVTILMIWTCYWCNLQATTK